jgi:hypothetical protein
LNPTGKKHLERKPRNNHVNKPLSTIELAQYVITMDGGATVLCEKHKQAFEHINTAMNKQYEVYLMEEDEDPISCQACHLAAVQANQTHH